MGFFDFITKRTLNKNAVAQPEFVRDYYPTSIKMTENDSTSFACVDRIASEFANLNYGIYDARTRQKVNKNKLYPVLKQPNLEDRHFNFFYQSAVDYFNGGCYWLKVMVEGELVSLFRLNPSQVTTRRNERNEKEYLYNGNVYHADDVIYIPSRFDYSTINGGNSIFKAVDSVFTTTRQIEKFTQSSFENGLLGKRIVIDVEGAFPNITSEQASELKQSFQREYSGAENAGRPILKKKGINYSEIGSSTDNNAQQLSENRKFQEKEIAKAFGVPVELLNGLDSKGNIENIFILFNEFAIKPIASQFQEAINSLLDEERFYFEFDFNGIMKVSLQQRIDAYSKQINSGLLSPNEARAKENLPPIEAGDNHFMPVNMMPLNDEIIEAYMAKQKNEVNQIQNQTDDDHSTIGDDK